MSETKTTETGARTQHTPGPWIAVKGDVLNPDRTYGVVKYLTLEQCEEIDGDEAAYPSRTEVIAEVCCGPTDEADAFLLAAAPELLEGVKDALSILSGVLKARPDVRNVAEIKAELEAVVAKAEGRS